MGEVDLSNAFGLTVGKKYGRYKNFRSHRFLLLTSGIGLSLSLSFRRAAEFHSELVLKMDDKEELSVELLDLSSVWFS